MELTNIMTEEVKVIAPATSLREAAQHMRSLNVGVLPICDGDRLIGILTDRDITIRAVAEGKDVDKTGAQEAMTPGIAYCFEDQKTEEAEQLMQERQIRRLPVLNREKRLVGIVSLGDLAMRNDVSAAGETLERISEPTT